MGYYVSVPVTESILRFEIATAPTPPTYSFYWELYMVVFVSDRFLCGRGFGVVTLNDSFYYPITERKSSVRYTFNVRIQCERHRLILIRVVLSVVLWCSF